MPIRQDDQGSTSQPQDVELSVVGPAHVPGPAGTGPGLVHLDVPSGSEAPVLGTEVRLDLDEPVELADGTRARLDAVVVDAEGMTLPAVVLLPDTEDHLSRLVDSRWLRTAGGTARALLASEDLKACPAVSVLVWGDPAEARAATRPGWSLSTCRARPPLTPATGSSLPAARTDPAVWDQLPLGTVELRHGTPVNCPGDGTVGHLTALSADARGQLSTLTFGVGHGRRTREVTLPVDHVESVRGGTVRLRVRRAELEWLRVA